MHCDEMIRWQSKGTPLQALYPAEILGNEIRAKGVAFQAFTAGCATFINQYATPIALNRIRWKTYTIFCKWFVLPRRDWLTACHSDLTFHRACGLVSDCCWNQRKIVRRTGWNFRITPSCQGVVEETDRFTKEGRGRQGFKWRINFPRIHRRRVFGAIFPISGSFPLDSKSAGFVASSVQLRLSRIYLTMTFYVLETFRNSFLQY